MSDIQLIPADEVSSGRIIDMGNGGELVVGRSWIGDHTLILTCAPLEDGRITLMHKCDPADNVRVIR
jgi:hypothetical protein